MALAIKIFQRNLSTSSICYGKKNFRKFLLYNKAGTRAFKKQQTIKPHPLIPIDKRGVRDVGYRVDDRFIEVPEMIPELIVPNLEGCKLKPYVSYQAVNISQSEFTSKDLFDAVYSPKIVSDFQAGKLDENGNPLKPNENELLTPEEAKNRALKTGSDIFTQKLEQPEEKYRNYVV
ncbi:39S ribosomal protein L41, mitochondrial [Chelonus insularis]|uniref:39S ribosomal protein L41, mitochondrial n=1 Tax=Chelonus insularis TaxID=460826 RepID=UPI00158DDF03|nr:39S ribosomal protein L41, mitochondrial [Chelonus insularis]